MRVIIDPFRLHNSSVATLEICDISTYKLARNIILQARINGVEIGQDLLVVNSPFIHWFNDVPEIVKKVTPKGVLCERNPTCKIPEDLDDENIINLDLLSLNLIPVENELFHHFFGMYPPQELLNISTIYNLAKIVRDKRQVLSNAYLRNLWNITLFKLINSSSELIKKNVLPLVELDVSFAEIICEGIYCSKNIFFLENWVHENRRVLSEADIDIEDFRRIISQQPSSVYDLDKKSEKVMEAFIKSNLQEGNLSYIDLSGNYQGEISAVLALKPQLDFSTSRLLQEKFAGKLSTIQEQKLLSLCIPEYMDPPEMSGLSLVQQSETWKQWAVDSFIPYKFYFDTAKERSDLEMANIEKGSLSFSDWLFNNYASIINDASVFSNLNVIDHVRNLLDEKSNRVIWLIVDGLPAYFSTILSGTLKNHGINKIDLNWSLATLPTITELGIPIMISGRFECNIDKTQSRSSILSKGFTDDKKCIYTTKVSDFQKSLESDFDLCCIHTHEIDTLMHLGDHEFDKSRAESAASILDNRIAMIADIIKQNPESKFKLVISTDHGATKCLQNAQGVKNSKLNEAAKRKPSERCLVLNDVLKSEVFDPEEIYLLKNEVSKNTDDWAIARGYRYFGSNDTGYRHGGLSPEEVVVPVMFCEIAPLIEAKLTFRYIGVKDLRFGKTEKDFRIKVKNLGDTSIEIISFDILEDKNCMVNLPVKIGPHGDIILEGSIKISQKFRGMSKGGKLSLNLAVKCQIMGHQISQNYTLIVATEKDDFEDDFEF